MYITASSYSFTICFLYDHECVREGQDGKEIKATASQLPTAHSNSVADFWESPGRTMAVLCSQIKRVQ